MAFLRSIRLRGFKTFARPTELVFEPGVAVIIGPNGSGKSNLTDAVLWALGEQSPTSIRGQSMQDVIFAGAEGQRPSAVAEVSLVFDNTCGSFPAGFQEVEITRRLTRDGEAGYRLNGSPCRLVDVQELISRVGLGREMHSVIGQGKVEEVLNSTPLTRRALVEEAAGLGAYKKRRERALVKLEHVRSNLRRAGDVEQEVRSAVRPLRQQVTAAQRYAELSEELAGLQTRLALLSLRDSDQALGRESERLRELEATKAGLEETLAQLHAKRTSEEDAFKRALAEREDRAALHHRALAEVERLRSRVDLLGERLTRAEGELSRAGRSRELAETELAAAAAELAQLGQAPGGSSLRLSRVKGALDSLEAQLEEVRPRLQTGEEGLESLKDRVLDLETARGRLRQERDFLQRELDGQVELRLRLAGQRDAAATRQKQLEGLLDARRQEFELVSAEISGAALRMARASELVEKLRPAAEEAAARAAGAAEQLEAVRSRRRVLERLAQAREGVPEASRRLLEVHRGSALVVEMLRVRPGYERAVAAVLGPLAHAVVVEAPAPAILAQATPGPVEVISLSGASAALADPVVGTGGAKAGLDLWEVVEGPPALIAALRRLQPGVRVVDELSDAPHGLRVSVAGEIASGEVHAARRGEPGAELLLAARAELASLAKAEETARRLLVAGSATRDSAEQALREALGSFAELEDADRHARRTSTALRDDLDLLERRLREALVQAAESGERLRKADERRVALGEDTGSAAARMTHTEKILEETRASVRALREQCDDLRRRVGRLEDKRGQASLLAARLRERERAREEERQRARHHAAVSRERLSSSERREAALLGLVPRLEALHSVSTALQRTLSERLESLAAVVDVSRRETDDFADRIKAHGEQEVGCRQRLVALGEELTRVRVAIAHEEDRRAVVERQLAQLRVRHLSPRSLGPDDVVGDVAERLTAAAAAVERRREHIGPVNPLAEQELRKAEERTAFLAEQRKDLEASLGELDRAIAELERHIRSTFAEVFAATRRNFEDMVQILFPGGHGALRLVGSPGAEGGAAEGAEGSMRLPEEAEGIAMEVRPARKGSRNLTLLSGGEKALAAIAFLFALFLSRPCPFYILDEVEAALDDVNIGRFLSLVERYEEQTQFLIITHQHRTMEIADTLYGVALDRDGTSRVLSRRLRTRAKDGPPAGKTKGATSAAEASLL